jgi:hypothetical protein
MRYVVQSLAIAVAVLSASSAFASPKCFPVFGTFQEKNTPGNPCNSPIGICLDGRMAGAVSGTTRGKGMYLTPTADNAQSGVVSAGGEIEFDGRVLGRRGTLTIKDNAIIDSVGRGDAVGLLTIVGGTGQLSGATGTIRVSGVFDLATLDLPTSSYQGEICLP